MNKDILEKFVNTVRGKDGAGSNLLNISMGPHLSDALLSSAIIQVGQVTCGLSFKASAIVTYDSSSIKQVIFQHA